jgi:poly(beta-D-mannuronate) lyase
MNLFSRFLLPVFLSCACTSLLLAFPSSMRATSPTPAHGGKRYSVSSAEGISRALKEAKAGDTLVMQDGVWRDQQIVFKGRGTYRAPLVLVAQTPGQVILSGNSSLRMAGSYLEVKGLVFAHGYRLKDDVIAFRDGKHEAFHCRLTATVIRDYNSPYDSVENHWISLYGTHNRVAHCFIEGKTNDGTTLVVWLDGHPNYHRIDHNYFGHRPPLGYNGGETIRVGTSTWSQTDSYTMVDDNYFNRCDGEIEVISNKSCHNTYRHNTFHACEGTLTLRHGNYATVEDNFFFGEGVPSSGGVRVIGSHHLVINNYFQDLTGTGLYAAISIMNAQRSPALNGYWPVYGAVIVRNTMVHCKENVLVGSGAGQRGRVVAPDSCYIADNRIFHQHVSGLPRAVPVDSLGTGPAWMR